MVGFGILLVSPVSLVGMPLPLFMQLFDQLTELFCEAVHGALEAREQVERDDDGEAYAGDGREQVLFHVSHLPLS